MPFILASREVWHLEWPVFESQVWQDCSTAVVQSKLLIQLAFFLRIAPLGELVLSKFAVRGPYLKYSIGVLRSFASFHGSFGYQSKLFLYVQL